MHFAVSGSIKYGCADFNIHWLDDTDQSLVIVDGGNRGTMKKTTKGQN